MLKLRDAIHLIREDENFFCREGCPEFAIVLNEFFGYDLKLLIDESGVWDNEMPGDKRKKFPIMAHVFAEDNRGNTFDVHGQRSVSQMIKQFQLKEPDVRDVSRYELVSKYMGTGKPFYELDGEALQDAKDIVRENPEKYKS